MTTSRRILWLALCLAGSLSCSPWRAPVAVPGEAAPDAVSEQRSIEAEIARFQTGLNRAEVRAVAAAILEEADLNGLRAELILALIQTESAFDNFARSRVGALGLMQVMPATGEMLARQHGLAWSGPETLFDPVVNVRLGCRYLAFLRARYGRLETALAAYNWGPGAIDRRLAGGAAVPRRYPTLVLARLDQSPDAAIAR
jgi:soluble lytic murein transglycosylase-like protein